MTVFTNIHAFPYSHLDRGQVLPPALFEHEANAIPDPENVYLPEGRHEIIRERPLQPIHGIQDFVEQLIEGGAR